MRLVRNPLLVPLLVVWLGLAAQAAEPPARVFQSVPQTHWAYDAVQQLAQRGFFTGYPDGTFAGKKALTRYEFAVAIQRLLQEVQRLCVTEQAGLWNPDTVCLQKLVQELGAELTMLGADVDALNARLNSMRYPWRFEPPDLAVAGAAAYPGVGVPEDPGYQVGQWLAASEWERGDTAFYVTPYARQERASRSTGIPYRAYGKRDGDPYALSVIAGHNAEVQARLRRFGAPKRSGGRSAPVEAPTAGGGSGKSPRVWRVTLEAPEACSRDGRVLLRLEEHGVGRPATLRITLPERAVLLSLDGLADRSQAVEASLDVQDANVLWISLPAPSSGQNFSNHRWRIDLTTGVRRRG